LRLEVLEDRNLLSLSSITSYAAGSSPAGVTLGDFNNDTRLDLAVVNYHDNTVSVLLAKPDGTFGPAQNASTGAYPVSLAVGDFNGDGMLDIATANEGPPLRSRHQYTSGQRRRHHAGRPERRPPGGPIRGSPAA
jgi:hypothetical protein